MKGDGKKDHHQTRRDGENGTCDFLHREKAGVERGHAFLDVADYIFENDDSVVHNDTDRKNKGEKGEDVDAVPEAVKEGKSSKNGNRNSGGRDNGRTGFVKKKEDENNNEKNRNNQGDNDLMDGVLDIKGGIEGDVHLDVGRKDEFDLLQFASDPLGDIDGIGIGLFHDAEADRRLTAESGDGLFDRRAYLHRGNVPQADGAVA